MQGHSLFDEAKMRIQEVGLRSMLSRYAGVAIPDKRRFNCILPSHEDRKQSASIIHNHYKCFSAHCESSQGIFGNIDLIACLKGDDPKEIAKMICRDFRSSTPPVITTTSSPVPNIKPCKSPMFGLSEAAHNALAYFWKLLNETSSIDHPVLNEWLGSRNLSIEGHYNYGVRVVTKQLINQLNPNDNAVIEAGLNSKWIGQEGTILIPVNGCNGYPLGYRLRRARSKQPKEMDMKGRRVDLGNPLPPLGIRCLLGWGYPEVLIITEGTPDYLTALECVESMELPISVIGLNKVSSRLDEWILESMSKSRYIIDFTHIKEANQVHSVSKPLEQIINLNNRSGLFRHGLLESNDLNDHHKRGEAKEFIFNKFKQLGY